MTQSEDFLKLFSKSEELIESLKRGRQFTEELLHENEKLRMRIIHLETQLSDANSDDLKRLRAENEQLTKRMERLERRFSQVEEENKDFAQRYIKVEEQNEALANLYVASYQLHSTLDPSEVVQIIVEIIINLIGAEEFSIFMVDEGINELVLMGGELGSRSFNKGRISVGQGIEGQVAASGKIYRAESQTESGGLICVPLKIKEEMIGVICIYKLLDHKKGFTSLDYELLNLLAGHAATALLSSKLYHGTERKLRTIEGFMNLLRSQ
jgi:nitrate/nitrite-specific signal transduction histidine kinase